MTTRRAMFPATLSGLIGAEVSKIETRRGFGGGSRKATSATAGVAASLREPDFTEHTAERAVTL
jgi:hypothetical protein